MLFTRSLHNLAWKIETARCRLVPHLPFAFRKNMNTSFRRLARRAAPFTLTTIPRMHALYEAIQKIVRDGIEGSAVECGTWKGGSMMLAASALIEAGAGDRDLFLYDTFQGMPLPGDEDVTFYGLPARKKWNWQRQKTGNGWFYAPFSEVRDNMNTTGYPSERVTYVEGLIEKTLPRTIPDRIAFLHLDMDLYAPTLHALRYLYPRMSKGGVLIIDDYGHWKGARKAVDHYFETQKIHANLQKIDYSAVWMVRK